MKQQYKKAGLRLACYVPGYYYYDMHKEPIDSKLFSLSFLAPFVRSIAGFFIADIMQFRTCIHQSQVTWWVDYIAKDSG